MAGLDHAKVLPCNLLAMLGGLGFPATAATVTFRVVQFCGAAKFPFVPTGVANIVAVVLPVPNPPVTTAALVLPGISGPEGFTPRVDFILSLASELIC